MRATMRSTNAGTRLRGSGKALRHGSTGMCAAPRISTNTAPAWRRRPVPDLAYTADEMMTVAAARMLRNGAVCFVGIGLPSAAANLARLTHAPEAGVIYESR